MRQKIDTTENWEEVVRSSPHLYFESEEISPVEICKALEFSARALGATRTKCQQIGDWWYFCADVDWLYNSAIQFDDITDVFTKPCPFPEANRLNCFRLEALCAPFSSDVYTRTEDTIIEIKGSAPLKLDTDRHFLHLQPAARVVGFKFLDEWSKPS